MSFLRLNLAFAALLALGFGSASADDLIRNYGATDLTTTPAPLVSPPQPVIASGTSTIVASQAPVATMAFGHHRRGGGCCGYGSSFPSAYYAYNTWQPDAALRYSSGYAGYPGGYVYPSPNPYGYYPNGWYWGSSGPTYRGPFPVWNSPSNVYDYRYLGWGSYGWGGWGGTGPAGWGYQGGFYW